MPKIPQAKHLAYMIAAGWAVFVTTYLIFWETHPEWQTILNRLSWSTADFIALAATALALYTYSLFQKGLEAGPIEQVIKWAADPANKKELDAIIRNALSTEAMGQALDVAIEYARKKIISSFEGKAGVEIREARKSLEGAIPPALRKIFENEWVDHAVKAVSIIDGILQTLKGGRPPEPPDQGSQ